MSPTKNSHVIVVGSGMAGLTAARSLINAGWNNVLVIEAKDHLGGRTYTQPIPGTSANVDVGAAWILGNVENPVADACNKYKIPYERHCFEMAAFVDATNDNQRITFKKFHSLRDIVPDMIEKLTPGKSAQEAIDEYLNEEEKKHDLEKSSPDKSDKEAMNRYLNQEPDNDVDRRLKKFVLEQVTAGTGGLEDRLASYFPATNKTGKVFKGGDYVIRGGYNRLVSAIAHGVNYELGCVVKCLRLSKTRESVEVICSDGKIISADYVILTAPLGVLKAGSIGFEPSLSQSKLDSLSKLDMGNFEKVIFTFDEYFWKDFVDIAPFKDNVGFYHGMKEDGCRPFSYFADLTRFAGAPTIVCLYDGLYARFVQENFMKCDEYIIWKCRMALAALLHMDFDDLPDHSGVIVTHWNSDPYTMGSFSYFVIGSDPSDMDEVAEPEWNGRLMFAGEHTCKDHNGTVHGAFLSGLREAQRLDPDAKLLEP